MHGKRQCYEYMILAQMKTIQKFKQTEFIEAVTMEKRIVLLKWKTQCVIRGNVCSTDSNFIRIYIT